MYSWLILTRHRQSLEAQNDTKHEADACRFGSAVHQLSSQSVARCERQYWRLLSSGGRAHPRVLDCTNCTIAGHRSVRISFWKRHCTANLVRCNAMMRFLTATGLLEWMLLQIQKFLTTLTFGREGNLFVLRTLIDGLAVVFLCNIFFDRSNQAWSRRPLSRLPSKYSFMIDSWFFFNLPLTIRPLMKSM